MSEDDRPDPFTAQVPSIMQDYDALRRRRGEGMYTPLRAMLTRHVCDASCVCPVHGTFLIYWPAGDDHACQDISCRFGHGVRNADAGWSVVSGFRAEGAAAAASLGLHEPGPDDPLWWLSSCDPAKAPPPDLQRPGGPSFLGAVITQAPTLAAAITRSHVLKVNPGGEVKILGPLPERYIGREWRDRLLTAAEVEAIPEPEGLAGD